jgi:flavodoxin
MKTIVICLSYHHNNTQKIASVIASALHAEIKTPQETNPADVSEYDLIGFGSGIYFGKHHKSLLEFADKLPQVTSKKAFIFSTSGQKDNMAKFHKHLKAKLQGKGFEIVSEFNCAALDTYGLMKITGGLNKGHPNAEDLKQAEAFAQSLNQTTKP